MTPSRRFPWRIQVPGRPRTILRTIAFLGISWLSASAEDRQGEAHDACVNFGRDIRAILADACYRCHGPDPGQRKADLRLDVKGGPFGDAGGHAVVVPGDISASELYLRITHPEQDQRMPPADTGRQLTPSEIDLIRRWIEQGATWEDHWSFVPPRRPPLPIESDVQFIHNAIDLFVARRLRAEGLTFSPPAAKETLIRRLTLDLTGLPPSPDEVDAFIRDPSPDAYVKLVDRLLSSPRFGERMASPWLDVARYADTSGYQNDGPRFMWRWRDWVIDAFNRNLPFDQFTIEQLAGDLLPSPTLDQVIATGFNRNHRGNAEGGIIPEEYAVEYVVDRVETTCTAWLGMTIGCARCHSHKFDPISQREFYQLFAYFNRVPEHGRAIKEGNSPPMIKAPTPRQQARLSELDAELTLAQTAVDALANDVIAAQVRWEATGPSLPSSDWTPSAGLAVHFSLDDHLDNVFCPSSPGKLENGEPMFGPGRLGQAAIFDGRHFIHGGDIARFGYFDKFTFAAWILPTQPHAGTILSRMVDEPQAEGYSVSFQAGKLHAYLVKRWLDDAIRVSTRQTFPPGQWYHVAVTYDGSRLASGVRIYVDGASRELDVQLDGLNQTFSSVEPFRIGGGGGAESRFRGSIDEVRVYGHRLSDEEIQVVATPTSVVEILARPPSERTDLQATKLRAYFLDQQAPDSLADAFRRLDAVRRQRDEFLESIPTVMVMRDIPDARDTFVLHRGQYDQPGDKVAPGLPASLTPSTSTVPNNRLGLARWLVDPANPLTARVTVNRLWQILFGAGLVSTSEDFGIQGERPSHPDVLDWLAVELMRTGWDIKALVRTIVTSATYQQSSCVTPVLAQLDTANRLLARGPRVRLSAEMIRDQALAASGLLVERLGGPSVKPYQPDGLWKEIATDTEYQTASGADLYRRGLYTYWKRTVAPPAMVTFDATTRETCVVRSSRTNTPLQALTLMNDVTFVESARVLAQRVMMDGGSIPADRIALAFRRVVSRAPTSAELTILMSSFEHYLSFYAGQPEAARELCRAGEFPVPESLDATHLAAYSVVASVILNLDEAITKE